MQRRAAAVDRYGVGAVLFWLACSAVGASVHVAVVLAMSTQRAAGLGAVAAAAMCCCALGLAAVAIPRAGRQRRWLLAAALASIAARAATSAVDGGLTELSRPRAAQPRGVIELEVIDASTSGPSCEVTARGGALTMMVGLPQSACPLSTGQRLRIPLAELDVYDARALPWDPDPRELARARGVDRLARADTVFVTGTARSAYWSWVARQRHHAWQISRGDDARALVVASALGLRAALSPERRAELTGAGLGHIVAVSGMNVTLGAWILQHALVRVGARVGGSLGIGVILSWIPLVAYVGLTGAAAAAVRSAAMLVLVGLGTIVGRPAHGLVVLFASAAGMLAVRPAWALDPGFQLSTVAMLALLTAPPSSGALTQTWRVVWSLLPIGMIHFDDANGYAVVSNLVAVPVFTLWVLPLAAVGWCLVPALGGAALEPAGWGAQAILDVAALVSRLPPLPLELVCAAALAFVVQRVLPHGWRPRWLMAASPPLLACVASLAVLLVPWRVATVARGARWYAIGSARAHTILAATDELATVCIRAPTMAAARWPRLLRSLGIERVAGIDDGERDDAPHVVELRGVLARLDMITVGARCAWPDRSFVRRAVNECARMRGASPTMVAGGATPWCRRRDGWARLGGIDSGR